MILVFLVKRAPAACFYLSKSTCNGCWIILKAAIQDKNTLNPPQEVSNIGVDNSWQIGATLLKIDEPSLALKNIKPPQTFEAILMSLTLEKFSFEFSLRPRLCDRLKGNTAI